MTITEYVRNQLFDPVTQKLVHVPMRSISSTSDQDNTEGNQINKRPNGPAWSPEEHRKFLMGLEQFPSGPWKKVAAFVETKTTRQTISHAQKYRRKLARQQQKNKKLQDKDTGNGEVTSSDSPMFKPSTEGFCGPLVPKSTSRKSTRVYVRLPPSKAATSRTTHRKVRRQTKKSDKTTNSINTEHTAISHEPMNANEAHSSEITDAVMLEGLSLFLGSTMEDCHI